jgi:hypothetical protein
MNDNSGLSEHIVSQNMQLNQHGVVVSVFTGDNGGRSDDAASQNMQLNRNGVMVPVLTNSSPTSPRTLKEVILDRITRARHKISGGTPKPQPEEEQALDCGEHPYLPHLSDETSGQLS